MERTTMLQCLIFMITMISFTYSDETFDKLFTAKKYEEALEYVDQKIPPTSRSAEMWVKIAQANESIGLIEKALASYMVSWRMKPKNYDALLGTARIYNKLGKSEEAKMYAQKALLESFTGEASWEYARACIDLNKPSEAKKALEKVIETDPHNIVANRELGNIYYSEKLYSKAVSLLQKSFATKADPEVAFQIGKSFLETSNIDSAMAYLEKAVALNPAFYEARLELARAYYGKSMYDKAVNEYKSVERKISFDSNDYYHYALALEQMNNKLESYRIFRLAIQKYGNQQHSEALTARYKVGTRDLENQKYAQALEQFTFIVKADPRAARIKDIFFLLADAYDGLDNAEKAIQWLEEAIASRPTNYEAYARLASLYLKNKMEDKAKATYEKMMSLSPNDPKVYLTLGEFKMKEKKYSEALELFVKSNSLQKNADALEGIAIAASRLNQWDKARDAAESVIAIDGSRMESRIVLSKALMRERSYKEARIHLEFLVQKKPMTLEYWTDLAECYDKLNETALRANADQQIIKLDSKNTMSRLRHARYLLAKNDSVSAYSLYKELAVLRPDDPIVFKNLYTLAAGKNDNTNAVVYLQKYLELNPNDAELQRDLGDLLYERKDFDGALVHYRKAIQIDPGIKGFFKRYAEIVVKKGQQDEVIKALNGVIKAGEADFSTYSTLGVIYMKKQMHTLAKQMYQKALMLEPQNTEALSTLGECQVNLGEISDAVITYEQVIMLNPKAVEEYKALGDLYTRQRKEEQAMRAYTSYLDATSDSRIAQKVGDYYYDKKDYHQAAKYLSMVKGKDADDFNHLLKLGISCFHDKQYSNVVTIFDGLLKRNPKLQLRKQLLLMSAQSFEQMKKINSALDAYDSYSALKGASSADVDFKRAQLRESTNKTAAQKIYEENINRYPTDSRNYLQLGLLYSKSKSTLSLAAPMLEKAAARAGKNTSLWLQIAQIYGKLGKENEELRAYKRYIEADPQNLDANIRIGAILMEKGKISEGMIYLETANTLSPDNIEILGPLATGYLKTNRSREALEILDKAKKIKPDDLDIRRRLFETYKKIGDRKAAIQEIKEMLAKKRENDLLLIYAELLLEEGQTREAENAIENIMATNPENIKALMVLAKLQRARKKYNDAIETYKEIIYIDANYAPALYERAETYMLESKPQWAERFYDRALRADPDFALAELGLAKLAKLRKDQTNYLQHLRKALQLDPDNQEIVNEAQKAGIQ